VGKAGLRIHICNENYDEGCTFLANGVDALDESGTCTANRWLLNTYETADPACLLDFPHRIGPPEVSGAAR
jgi:hypothetical protein